MIGEELEVLLPQTADELESYMAGLIYYYKLPDTEDTRDMIATMILHLPQGKAYVTSKYFADAVYKGLANKAAFDKLKIYRENREKLAELEALKTKEQDVSNAIEQPIQNT